MRHHEQQSSPPSKSRHCTILAIALLFLIAALTGSAHLFAIGAIGALVLFPL
jgi:hypothetical protein